MAWPHCLAWFLAGALLVNAVPHVVNLVAGYLLPCCVGDVEIGTLGHVIVMGSGAMVIALLLARRFGRFHGGNASGNPLNAMASTFRSFESFNYRVWAGGAIVSNVGTWMQRIAQDWLVLTQLTHHSATAWAW